MVLKDIIINNILVFTTGIDILILLEFCTGIANIIIIKELKIDFNLRWCL